ncbi:MAG: type II secretion system F family protein [Erysipelotrichaceae bacterium]|nr:type II secretion system F family protein [Erysipelotrichaceae bacterium]
MMNYDLRGLETLAMLLDQGFYLDDALTLVLTTYPSKSFKEISRKVHEGESLESGITNSTLPHVFLEYFRFFNNGLNTSEAINQALTLTVESIEIRKFLFKKISYPFFLIVFVSVFCLFLIFSLMPQINLLFTSFNIEPSIFTNIVFSFLNVFPVAILTIFLFIISIGVTLIYGIRKNNFPIIDFFNRLYGLNWIIRSYYSLKFAIYYNELVKNGYSTGNIIHILYSQMDSSDLKMVIYELKKDIEQGSPVEQAVKDFNYFNDYLKNYFHLMIVNNAVNKNLDLYIQSQKKLVTNLIERVTIMFVPFVFGFVAIFIVSIYLAIILPLMNSIELM